MIINETVSSPIISNVLAAPSKFKIKASAKAFKILSGFYSEPILAIPRELGANAWDSHVKAKNTKQMFEVHAPNTLEPWFSIRDFGTGLSADDIDSIYTTYFESTKTSDNDSDGCMGLGSKTPFNYTDNFNVTSFYKGKKYVYNCFIDETGSPNIMQIAVMDTTEHNGLEIKFGVKITDITMWVDKITRAYEPFRYRPIIKGAKIEYKPREYIYEGKKWAMRKNDDHNYYIRGCNAFMGNYCYPINATAFQHILYTEKLDKALNYGNFDLFFDIGELEVAPNKEQLQYEDGNSTTTAIVAALKNAVAELKTMVEKSVESPKSLWHAMYLYNKYNGYNSQYSHVRNTIGDISITFNGEKILVGNDNVINIHKKADCYDSNGSLPYYRLYTLDNPNGKMRSTNVYHPHSDTRDILIFYTNSLTIKKSRICHYLNTKYAAGKAPMCFIIVDTSDKLSTFHKHAKYFGWHNSILIDIDALPKPPSAPRQKKVSGTNDITYADISGFYNKNTDRYSHMNWSKIPATFDSNGTYYYINFYHNNAVYGPDDKPVTELVPHAVKLLVANKILTETTIYGVNMKNKPMLKIGNWINIMDLAKKEVLSSKEKYEQELYVISQCHAFENMSNVYNILTGHPSIINKLKNASTAKMFKTFIKTYKVATDDSISVDERVLELFGVKSVKHASLDMDPKEFGKIIEDRYFNVFNTVSTYNSDGPATIVNIINFVDDNS